MINWLKNIFDSGQLIEATEWRTDNSIFKFLSDNIESDGTLNKIAHELPDEQKGDDNKLRYAPGLMDAMFGADDSEDSSKKISELVKTLSKVSKNGDKAAESTFYNLIISNEGVISIIDDFLKSVVEKALPIEPYLFNFSKDLALKTQHRNSVKFGIAMLGLCQNKSVIKELKCLALHDEFTVFSAVAISNISDEVIQDMWDLVDKVEGWGKIQLVDRLANMDNLNDSQRDWLVRKGYKNSIMYEYLAYTCAVNGKLHEKLARQTIDTELFKSAGDIIDALITGSPGVHISEYDHAVDVFENYVSHAKVCTSDIADFLTLHKIRDFLIEIQGEIGDHKKNGWTIDIISNCIIDITAVLESRDWTELTLKALKSIDNITYWNGKSAADKLGIDIWEVVWAKLLQNPIDSTAWYDVTRYAKPDKVDQVIEFAVKNIPLNELATGPKDSLGLGPEYLKHQSLDYVITYLEKYPRKGEQIILAGLNSPVTRNRNMCIKVLSKWKSENWSDSLRNELEKLQSIEPSRDTKENISKLIKGEELGY